MENRSPSLLELSDKHADRISTMGIRAIAAAHAAGVPAYFMDAEIAGIDEIIREDADGRRFVVEIVAGAPDRVIRELPPATKA